MRNIICDLLLRFTHTALFLYLCLGFDPKHEKAFNNTKLIYLLLKTNESNR